ncbi:MULTISPECIES: FAD-dependent oxidoreductase [unclassified Pseudomonas]|uniref:NAD(P)/FAD-dependent oxidoreductase n=1 Tax=unclassified Pseudomonas TaxID=196821 RepID=UPI002AC8E057|nr:MULTISPECIES: FAD-dependent oxidoreductase [unclassified Pseudomonas]MEB0047499.1 FAD-dependent oxidoreductase [Pseudomonas sp. Dout3]MEB0097942.1 FAD-dependent oxidoreductase [Pseudomonas sp. DC1.2]WPX61616.1 FAD-dependent oxidoreductase [Pseudomonas sp. DC1.2]
MTEGLAADVIVIGAGIIGAACARSLARRGMRVLVLDAGLPGATAAGMGHLLVLDDNPAELALSQYSLQRWRELAPALPEGCAYRSNGTLWLAANAEEMAVAHHKYINLQAQGVACELIASRALREREPELREGLEGGLLINGDGILYAPATARWMLDIPNIHQRRARVSEVDGHRVRLDDGQWLNAEAVVLANGIQANELCPELPIEPKKGHLLITDRYPGKVTHTLVELGYVTSAHNASGPSTACNIQPRPTGQLFIGASRQFGTLDPQVEGWMLAKMLRRATSYMPGLAQLNGIRAWTGFRAASPDGLPLVGQHPQCKGLWLAVGHEGLGVTTATGTADLLVAQLFNETPPLAPQPYLPQRFLGAPAYA